MEKVTFAGQSQCTTIGSVAFASASINEINLPKSIKTIGRMAFVECDKLVKIDIASDSVTIGKYAFATNVTLDTDVDVNGYVIDYICGDICPFTGEIYVNNSKVKKACIDNETVDSNSVIIRKYDIELYVKNGNSWTKKVTRKVGYNDSVQLSSIAPKAASGYSYVWYKDQNFRNYASNTIRRASKDGVYRLYGKNRENLYNIIFMANNGSTYSYRKEDVRYTETVSLPQGITPAVDGYVFDSWNTKADGTGTTYTGTVSKLTTGKEIVLFAVYKKWYSTRWFGLINANHGRLYYRSIQSSLSRDDKVENSVSREFLQRSVTYAYVDAAGNNKEIEKQLTDIADGAGWIALDAWNDSYYIQQYPNIDKKSDFTDDQAIPSDMDRTLIPNAVYKNLTVRFDGSTAENTMDDVVCVRGRLNGWQLNNKLQKEGYEFAGWTVSQLDVTSVEDADGGSDEPVILVSASDIKDNRISEAQIFALYMFADPNQVVTLKPVWNEPEKYNVIFKAGGGTGSMQTVTLECGRNSRLPECTFKKKGCLFAGWAIDGEDTVKYADGAIINRSAKDGDMRLKAMWKPITYKLVYNANGGQGFMPSEDVASASVHTLRSNAYEKSGEKFNGWNTEADGSGRLYKDGSQLQYEPVEEGETFNLYADWSVDSVTIIFDANGGSVSKAQKVVGFGETCGVLPDARRDGYEFLGWFTRRNGGTQYSSGTTVDSDSDITLYAHWEAKKYTVTFNGNGGTGVTTASKTIMAGKSLGTLPTAKKDKAIFAGWYTSPNGGSRVSASFKVDRNYTFYAHWTDKTRSVRVTFNIPKIKNVKGYEVQYSTSAGFGGASSVYGAVRETNQYVTQVGGLKAGTKYYFRARAYAVKNGKKIYGSWSGVSSKTTSK